MIGNRLRAVKAALDSLLALLGVVVLIALFGGYTGYIFGKIPISIHRVSLPFSMVTAVFLIRLLVASPPGLSFGGIIDFWLERARAAIRRICVSPDGRIRGPYRALFGWTGLPIPDTDMAWNMRRAVGAIAVVLTLFFLLSPTYRYLNHGRLTDIGIFVEAIDSAANGGLFENSFHFMMSRSPAEFLASEENTMSMFASHFRPSFFLLVPPYRLFPSPLTLFFLQALIVGSSVWPAFYLAKDALGKEQWALAATISYALNPSVLAISWSFFPEAATITLMLWAFFLASRNRYVLMSLCLVIALGTKESMALPVLSFGAYMALIERKRMIGAAISVFSIAYLFLCTQWIIPAFGDGMEYQYAKIYEGLGSSLGEIIITMALKPWKLFPYIFSASVVKYILALLLPVAFLPVLGWKVWILNLPVLAQNILAGPARQNWILKVWGLWSAPLIPFTFMSVIKALHSIKERHSADRVRYTLVVLVICSFLSVPLYSKRVFWSAPTYKAAVAALNEIAPENAVVSTNVMSGWCHMLPRYDIYRFPKKMDSADFVFVRANPARGQAIADQISAGVPMDALSSTKRWEVLEYEYLVRLKEEGRFTQIWEKQDAHSGDVVAIFENDKRRR